MYFIRMGLGLSCHHRSIATATPVSTSQHHSLAEALRICPAGVLLALAMLADISCPKQQVELDPRENSRRNVPRHNAKGETTAPRESCCPSVPRSSQGAPVCGYWHYTPVLAYRYPGDAQTSPADPKSKGSLACLTPSEPDLCLLAGSQPALHRGVAVAVESIPAPGQRGFKAGLCLQALSRTREKHKLYGLCSFAQHIQPKATTAPTKDLGPPKYALSLTDCGTW